MAKQHSLKLNESPRPATAGRSLPGAVRDSGFLRVE